MSLRVCMAAFDHVLELGDDGQTFSGSFAPAHQFLVDSVRQFFPNVSFMSSNKLGDMHSETMMFDGCLGRLQRNESDAMIQFVPFPVLGSGLIHSKTGDASKIVIFSMYNNTAAHSDTDVMDAFNSFSPQLWSLVAVFTAILTVIVFMTFRCKLLSIPKSKATGDPVVRIPKKQRTRRCIQQAFLIAAANILKQHTCYSYKGKSLRGKVVLLVFDLFSFLMVFYFSSMIKTEMVVQKRPETISSYEDVLAKPQTKPLWFKQMGNDHWDFMQANRDTPAGRIWERAQRFGIDSCFLKSGPDVQQSVGPVHRKEAVWLVPSYIVGVIVSNMCLFHHETNMYADINTWVRSDDAAREKLNVLIVSAAMPAESFQKFNRIVGAEFQNHLRYKSLKRIEFSFFPDKMSKSFRDCMANRIIYHDYEITAVHSAHYSRLFVLSGYFLLCGLLVLSSEMIRDMKHRFTLNKPETHDSWQNLPKSKRFG